MKNNSKSIKNIGVILLVAVLMLTAFAGGTRFGTSRATRNEGQDLRIDASTLNKMEIYHVDGNELVINTPFGDLRYSSMFDEFLQISQVFSQNKYAVQFNADLGTGTEVNVFTVYYTLDNGSQPNGDVIGEIRASDGTVYLIIVAINEAMPDETWDKDTCNLVYAMQEEIQYCTESITQQEGFITDC